MIAMLIIALLMIAAFVSLISLADSAVRAQGNWTVVRREMALQAGFVAGTNANVVRIRSFVTAQRPIPSPRPAPRLPQAAAA